MTNEELLHRLRAAAELGTASKELLEQCGNRIAAMEDAFDQIRSYCQIRNTGDFGELRGALEEIEGHASHYEDDKP